MASGSLWDEAPFHFDPGGERVTFSAKADHADAGLAIFVDAQHRFVAGVLAASARDLAAPTQQARPHHFWH
jgi:hypothetical protein